MKNALRFFAPPPPLGMTLTALATMLLVCFLLSACQRDGATVEQAVPNRTSDIPSSERTSCSTGYCMLTVYTLNDVTLEFCGDITPSIAGCDWGCDSNNDDRYNVSEFDEMAPVIYCVLSNGSVCIRNPTMDDAVLYIQFGTSTVPLPVTIPPNTIRCFHTDDCESTSAGCY